jgi:dethiobiotin synthetase
VIHPPAYSLKAPLSPHHAARLEDTTLDLSGIIPPNTRRPLIIEGVGGLLVPLNTHVVALDLFEHWHCEYVVVSRHYIGSINHTLLTIEALKRRGLPIHCLEGYCRKLVSIVKS